MKPTVSEDLYLDTAYFTKLAETYGPLYQNAQPFPHIVIDNFLPEPIADAILEEFDQAMQKKEWDSYTHEHSKKLAIAEEHELGPITRHVIGQLHGSHAISFLEKLTGIDGLIPDPHIQGGGLHRIEPGGFLDVHADFNWYERLRLDRRLNLLLYLNKDWEESYGGHLELWDTGMVGCQKKVLPIFNRCVIFNTTDFSYHGHPLPLTCPPDRKRKSLALYYYSNGRPAGEVFRDLSQETLYFDTHQSRKLPMRVWVRRLLPPVLFDAIRSLRKKFGKEY